MRIGLVASRFNQEWVDALLSAALNRLEEAGIVKDQITVLRVPGANEIPYAVSRLATGAHLDAVIALGCVLAGETTHHEVIAYGTSKALQDVSLKEGVPVINGIIVTESESQMEKRVGPEMNRGAEFAQGAMEMAVLKKTL